MPRPSGRRVVCLGEALVDFICERPVARLADAGTFVPRLGGSVANIAVAAARFGARAELLGGAGNDEWGRWLRERLAAEGVGVDHFVLAGRASSHAFVAVDSSGEPQFSFHAGADRSIAGAGERLEEALAGDPGVLVVGSDTLLEAAERDLTLRAERLARECGWDVVFDPNLRPRRWPDEGTMLAAVGAAGESATLIKCNEREAAALTGGREAAAAAEALLDRGASAVVITCGPDGAILATVGQIERVPATGDLEVLDATGAGDCVAGVIAAGLARGAAPDQLAPILAIAMDAAGGVVSSWGAGTGLPSGDRAHALLEAILA